MKLGSLFDGSGGFPLAGVMNGMTPVWASEIEPYPLRVTAARFPTMKQLGDVTKIDGASIDPVDVITFGSPCQDLSVAGKQTGIHDGKRSSLFFEAVRIIREMRGITDGKYPRFAVWENVPGAFSSNKGADFRAVLQALCEVADPGVSVPEPPKGKWAKAGCIVGDGYSIAWRVYDAQYWGVPQRRKRIYLVADFGSERAGEILFESEGVCGDSAESGEAREGTVYDAAGSAGRIDHVKCLNPWDCQSKRQYMINGAYTTLNAGNAQGGQAHGICYPSASFMGGQGAKAGGIGYSEKASQTLKSVLSGGNTVPDIVYACNSKQRGIYEAKTSRTLDLNGGNPSCNQGGLAIVQSYQKVVGALWAPTLTGDHENRITDYTAVAVYDTTQITSPQNYSNPKPGDACHPLASQQHPPLAVCAGNGQLNHISMAKQSNTLDCMHDQQIVLTDSKPPRKYIVRRLTPLECCRLQGFPDWWEDGANGSDSARYKMWGNGIALPCAADVMRRIAKEGA